MLKIAIYAFWCTDFVQYSIEFNQQRQAERKASSLKMEKVLPEPI
jgi:hypothetical protein